MVGRAVHMAAEQSLDPLFYIYPPLVFDLFAGAEALLSTLPGQHLGPATAISPGAEILAARLVSAAAAVVTVLLTGAIARRAYGPEAGFLAAAALAVAPLAVRQAHFATTDTVATALATGAIWAGQRAGPRRWLLLAGALAGLAAASKYTAGAALAYVLWRALADTPRLAGTLVAGLGFVVAAVAVVAPAGHLGAYWDGLRFLAGRSAEFAEMPPGWVYHTTRSLPFGLGPGALALAVAGLAAAWRRSQHDSGLVAYLVVSALPLALSHEVFFRYVLPMLPALCILGAGVPNRFPAGWARRLALGAALLLLVPSAYNSIQGDRLLGAIDTRQQAAEWLDANAPAGSGLWIHNYWAEPFYDAGELGGNQLHPLYHTGDAVADSFQQGLYTTRFSVNTGGTPCYDLVESGPPWQGRSDGSGQAAFSPGQPSSGAVYDQLDSFYLPIWNLEGIDRPGPAITVEAC